LFSKIRVLRQATGSNPCARCAVHSAALIGVLFPGASEDCVGDIVLSAELNFVYVKMASAKLIDDAAANAATVNHNPVRGELLESFDDFVGKLNGGEALEAAAIEGLRISALSEEEDGGVLAVAGNVYAEGEWGVLGVGRLAGHSGIDFFGVEEFHLADGGELAVDADFAEV